MRVRKILIALFLVLYCASGAAASSYRAGRLAHRVLHAASHAENDQIGADKILSDDERPRYREARKAGFEFNFRWAGATDLIPHGAKLQFDVSHLCWELHHIPAVRAARAPPQQA